MSEDEEDAPVDDYALDGCASEERMAAQQQLKSLGHSSKASAHAGVTQCTTGTVLECR